MNFKLKDKLKESRKILFQKYVTKEDTHLLKKNIILLRKVLSDRNQDIWKMRGEE